MSEFGASSRGSHAAASQRPNLHHFVHRGTGDEERESHLHIHQDGDLRLRRV